MRAEVSSMVWFELCYYEAEGEDRNGVVREREMDNTFVVHVVDLGNRWGVFIGGKESELRTR